MNKNKFLLLVTMVFSFVAISCEFGAGGNEPVVIVHNPNNLLFASSSDFSFDRHEVMLEFTTPNDFGSTSYTLQYSSTNNPYSFQTVTVGDTTYTTDNPNSSGYSLAIPDSNIDGYFRLLIHGGEYDGQYSNIEYATQCNVNVAFDSWGLDYGLYITGVMSPHVGSGIIASFSVTPDGNDSIYDSLTYQWYRIDLNNYENRELIVGQTDLNYVTVEDDIGYGLMIEAKGDPTNFNGGFARNFSDFVITD